jgi:hypothetical protein
MSGSNDEAPDLELSWQTFLGNQPRPPLNTEFVIARSAYIASWYASRAYAARSAPKAPVLLASNEQSAIVRAGEAFVAKFKREPVSASDCAWLNGYVAASGETPAELLNCGPGTPWDRLCGEPSCEYCGARRAADPDVCLTEMNISAKAGEPMEAYAQFEGGAVKAWAVSLVQWFRDSGGENYVTCDLRDPTTGEAYSITMQKAGGRTPAQDLCELRSQVKTNEPHSGEPS